MGTTLEFSERYDFMEATQIVGLAIFVAAVALAFRGSTAPLAVKISWMLYTVLIFMLSDSIWLGDTSYLRAMSEFYSLGALILLLGKTRLKRPAIGLWLFIWFVLLVFLTHVHHRWA